MTRARIAADFHLDAATIDRLARAIVLELARPVDPIETFLRFRREAITRQRTTTKARRRRSGGAKRSSGASASVTLMRMLDDAIARVTPA